MDNFEIIKEIGDGTFSKVFKVLRKADKVVYAMKRVKMASLT